MLAVDNLSGARIGGRIVKVDHVENYKKKIAEVQMLCCWTRHAAKRWKLSAYAHRRRVRMCSAIRLCPSLQVEGREVSESDEEPAEADGEPAARQPAGQASQLDVDGATVVHAHDAVSGDSKRQRPQQGPDPGPQPCINRPTGLAAWQALARWPGATWAPVSCIL